MQAAAAVYRAATQSKDQYASDFFPDTPFESIRLAAIRYSYREGSHSNTKTVRKPTDRWRGNPERPERRVEYIDLSRIQPVSARSGYLKLLKSGVTEGEHTAFDADKLGRLSQIIGKKYVGAGLSKTSADDRRAVPVVQTNGPRYSGFHQGAGEIAAAELLAADYPKYGIILIDEVETSLHPRAQRRLIRDLCHVAREKELQIILTTHSPYVLSELPPEARIYLFEGVSGKTVVTGVSPEFAMTRMDEEAHPEVDIYVEDKRAKAMVEEILISSERELLSRAKIIPFGTAMVGKALGLMAHQERFPRPSVVILDGDQAPSDGCIILPGHDAPERIVFGELAEKNWPEISLRIGRGTSETIDALNRAMSLSDHHDWPRQAADELTLGSDLLWQALCASWAKNALAEADRLAIVEPVREALMTSSGA
ncbi:ATP/GTP-binding protein [Roseomonas mucosa]|uniref:ATP/GTP-binding protein n=1 Tax=Roseomonas mucosa TaxID=207340 RepID=A0A4Y1MUM6_9PROT|nr:ATP/GTP-binding protein [Roseomonas mucosa]